MDMQNVSDLVIPEGEVRTIHDKDSRLIWGRVNYATKYAGDTYQQTYSGANLYNYTDMSASIGSGITTDSDGWITCTYDNSAGTSTKYSNYYTTPLALTPSTNYALVLEIRSVSGTGSFEGGGANAASQVDTFRINFADMTAGSTIVVPITSKSDVSGANGLRSYFRFNAGQSGSVTMRISVLADTSVTPETFVYQPFTGNIPAPNPDYPQDIQVVTGEQTVTIGDGVDSENFAISLGSLELCKLGNYQDYIYKSGDDWYVHKAIYKYTFTGEEPWQLRNTTAAGVSTFSWTFADMPVYAHVDAAANASKCSYLGNHGRVTNINQMYYNFIGFAFYNKADAPNLSSFYANTKDADLATFKSGVAGELLYYVLATVTDTKITDATLIAQLDAVHNWLTRYGYNATVTGNLPIVINQTNL